MLAQLKSLGVPMTGAEQSLATCPGTVFFLTDEFIRRHWPLAELPEDQLGPTLKFAAEIRGNARWRLLAWHLYRYLMFTPIAQFGSEPIPDLLSGLGERSGMLYLLTALSLIPSYIERAKREGFPVRYAEAGAKRIGSVTVFYAQLHNGAFGIRPSSLHFQQHYHETATWRIGRFDFQIRPSGDPLPEIYRRGGEIAAFCPDGARLDAAGNCLPAVPADNRPAARTAQFIVDGSKVTGIPIDFHRGLALPGTRTIDLKDGWEALTGPDVWTLFFHIPGGGKMTPEKCRESFAEAKSFFRTYAPDKDFRLIWSSSWIFNPLWLVLLPESNMAALIRRGRLFPSVAHSPNPGMYFVFGRDDGRPQDFNARNPVEKAVFQGWQEDKLRVCGFFLPTDEI